jgi:DNA-binding transcriptional ArsR family regulator
MCFIEYMNYRIFDFSYVLILATEAAMTLPLTPTDVFKSLADETRARITLLIVREGELCVCELTGALAQSQPKISRHLALLRASGLLMDRRKGQWIYYRLHPELPAWVIDLLRSIAAANQDWLEADARRLSEMNASSPNQTICN